MKLSKLGEFGLIERLRRATPKGAGVSLGIGDDAAWVTHPTGSSLVTTDLLIEGIHFRLPWTSLPDLGYKALAVNLSDIAAMGGTPAYLLLSLGIPSYLDVEDIDAFFRGLHSLARRCGVKLVGGDLSVAARFFISACVIGHAPAQPVTRNGAAVGNDIYVTGTIGDSALALRLLKRGGPALTRSKDMKFLLARHRRPEPRLAYGALLAREQLATAMIDISDGLRQDLGHICHASGTGARIWEQRLPLSSAYRALSGKAGTRYALGGGEDYELLFCAKPNDRERVAKLRLQAGVSATRIGTCVSRKQGISFLDSSGRSISVHLQGHDHFKKRARVNGRRSGRGGRLEKL